MSLKGPVMVQPPRVAYFSMEIGLESGMPTYSGGLGVLAGDTIRSAADLDVSMVAVSLLHWRGYFFSEWTRTAGKARSLSRGQSKISRNRSTRG